MNLQEINRRIAEHLGWTNILPTTGNPIGVKVGGDKNNPLDWLTIPDFCSSLDAMAQAEATLTSGQQKRYGQVLAGKIMGLDDVGTDYENNPCYSARELTRSVTASALHRARAFLCVVDGLSVEQTTP